MNRLTFCEPNGNWGIVGMNDANQDEKMYGVASKLKDYEKTGLNPSDFRADEYEKNTFTRCFILVKLMARIYVTLFFVKMKQKLNEWN